MKNYDAIIIGGGLSGLGVAALLSKKGYKTILLEKESILGGRSTSFPYRNYIIDIGLHTIASYSSSGIGRLVEEVGAVLELIPIKPTLMHYDLDTKKYMKATSAERFGDAVYNKFKELVKVVCGLTKDEIDAFHNISAEKWILDNFNSRDLVEFFKQITGFGGEPLDLIPAGVFLETLHDAFTSETTIAYPAQNGIKAFSDALERTIKSRGGEIITEINVQKILFKNDHVTGIKGKIIRPSLDLDLEVYAPLVVFTIPLTHLPRYMDSGMIGGELLGKIARIKSKDYYYTGLIAGVEASLLDSFSGKPFFQWTIDRKGMDWHAMITIPTYIDSKLAPKDHHLMFVDSHVPMPFGDTVRAEKRQDELISILKEIWPNFEKKIDWLHRVIYPNIWPLAQIGITGPDRPGFAVAGTKGLYLAGDAAYLTGSGIGSAIKSVFGCVKKIEETSDVLPKKRTHS
jgi:phytoene dehydrogenase-like protein